jgi:predicted RNA-binding protein YlqC (UPF0109 family)
MDAPLDIKALLYIPSFHQEKYGMGRMDPGVSMYSRKVLVESKSPHILPEWCRFIKGVVDSEDLPLSISREKPQDSALVGKMRKALTRKIISHLSIMMRKETDTYKEEFYKEYSYFLKEGVCQDFDSQQALSKLLYFETSKGMTGELVSLDEYVSRCPPETKDIYYLFAPTRELALQSPYMEAFSKNKREVIFIYTAIDDFVMANLKTFEGRELLSADRSDVDLPKSDDSNDTNEDGNEDKKKDDGTTTSGKSLSAAEATNVSYTPNHQWIEERDELSRLYVGRIIGKGGEMIRDLQARSGCRIDIQQEVTDVNDPRIICYRGRRQEDIELARHLVAMLCSRDPLSKGRGSSDDGGAGNGYNDGGGNNEIDWHQYGPAMHIGLPLGRAVMRQVYVPNSVVGRIIGRGGEVIRDLQCKSRARIQIDHNPPDDERTDNHYRRITITGTEEAACHAEDLLLRVSNTAFAADSKTGFEVGNQQKQVGAMPTSMVYPSYASVNQYVPHSTDSPTNTIETHRTLIETET